MTTWTRSAFAKIFGVADEPAIRRATTLVTVVLVLLATSEAAYGAANGGAGEAPMVLALFVLPLLYVAPASRVLWLRYRYPLLAAQAVLTCLGFVLFGASWISGPTGWLGGLVLLTFPPPASWIMATALAGAEEAVRAGVVGLPYQPAASSSLLVLTYFVLNALTLFGLARLADLIAAVHAARDELAEAAVSAERIRAAESLQAAIGGRLTAAAGRAAAALQAMAGSPARARENIAETEVAARQALAEVREVAVRYRDEARPEVAAVETGEPLAPRLAQAVLAVLLCGFAVLYVLLLAANVNGTSSSGYSGAVVGWTIADAVAVVALQLRHSWPSRGVARPQGWPATLVLQVLLTYALVPVTGWYPLIMAGFLAGSALLLAPTVLGRAAFAAMILSVPVVWAVKPAQGLTTPEWVGALIFQTLDSAALGLLVYALTRLAQLAVQLEDLRGGLARKAVVGERLRMARDTHDLLGLGLSAIAMKADLIGKLIGRDDARAGAEIADLARICATARADIRLVSGEARDLPLDTELAAARDVLASAGIEVRTRVSTDPSPSSEAAAVLVPVLREAVTNILKHSSASYCMLEMTADASLLQLLISNDGSDDNGEGAPPPSAGRAGNGLRNLAARLEEAGGRLIARRENGTFSLAVEVPLPALSG